MARTTVDRARSAFEAGRWTEAATTLESLDAEAPLEAEDLDRLATAAYLTGREELATDARTRAHHRHLENGDVVGAARSAFWLAFTMLDRPGQRAQAGGWLARASRLLDESATECAEQGFLLCAQAFRLVGQGDVVAAHAAFAQAAGIGARFGNPDLVALARHGQGRALLRQGQVDKGLAMLDEVMVSVTCGEVGPLVTGVVYCSVISACHERFDLARASEWTTALATWCAAHSDMVPFRGPCLIRRSELLQLHGDWEDALNEARRACAGFPMSDVPEAGLAFYQLAEMHRLRGASAAADDAYRQAALAGRSPQPGVALLRLADGDPAGAATAIRQALQDIHSLPARVWVLLASVEILAAVKDLDLCRSSVDELAALCSELDAVCVRAAAAQAAGMLALAFGDGRQAHGRLREALALWSELPAPYEVARTRVLAGLACRDLGDDEGARLEWDAAEAMFVKLGARPAVEQVRSLVRQPTRLSGGLTGREVEVLRLVASGRTNRAIAADLSISDRTVARHLANIFAKLDLPSRAAATAYAYRHKLV